MDSIWMETARMPRFKPLNGDLQTEVLIIGGGITGLLCAYFLEQAGVSYVLVEAGRICGGTTGRTTGKITAQHGLVYGRLIRALGEEPARLYLQAQRAALARYRSLCRTIFYYFITTCIRFPFPYKHSLFIAVNHKDFIILNIQNP